MINKRQSRLKRFCDDYTSIENYNEAVNDDAQIWDCHHRLEIQDDGTRITSRELISKGLYYHRPANELVFLTRSEHHRIHMTGNTLDEVTRTKISEAHKNKTFSAEHRRKLSEAKKSYYAKKKMTRK